MAEPQRSDVSLQPQSFPQQLAQMLRQANVQERQIAAGQRVFEDGSAGHEAYFIVQGSVNVLKRNEQGEEKMLDVLGPGQIFGEMALLDQPMRSATVVATADSRVFVIPRAQVETLIASVPAVALWLLQVFSRRLRMSNQKLAQMEKIQELNTRIIMGQETERRRIGRDIQEGPGQMFSDFIMRVDICEHLMKKGSDKVSDELSGLKDALNHGLARIQNIVSVLTPAAVQSEGLDGVLRRYVGRIQTDSGMQIQLDCPHIRENQIDFTIQNTVFYLVQAALSNIQGFCEAKSAQIALGLNDRALLLRVVDDGKGFDIEKVRQGLYKTEMENFEAMRDRVALVHGQLRLQSQVGKGTLMEIEIPLSGPGTHPIGGH